MEGVGHSGRTEHAKMGKGEERRGDATKQSEVVASDDIHRLRRFSITIPEEADADERNTILAEATGPIDAARFLNSIIERMDRELAEAGWPTPSQGVSVFEDGHVSPVPPASELSDLERTRGPCRSYLWAAEWILEQAVPLSDDHFRARIVYEALWLRDYEDDPGRRLIRGFRLGRLHEQLETRRYFGGDIKARRKAVRAMREDPDGGRREHNRLQAQRKRERTEAAQQSAICIWKRNPTLSVRAVAQRVKAQLQKADLEWSERSIREAISPVKPKPR